MALMNRIASPVDAQNEARIIECWRVNAAPWTDAVRDGQIESRRLVTDHEVIAAIVSRAPRSVLDIGCGEGWLVRALAARGIDASGADAVPELIDRARTAGGDFRVASMADLVAVPPAPVDLAVCNFSLFGKASVEALFAAVPRMLAGGGAFVVQTLHPVIACGDLPYREGWRDGTWAGFGPRFQHPAPWYFRTVAAWCALFESGGWRLREIREPTHPTSGKPVSIIFIASCREPEKS